MVWLAVAAGVYLGVFCMWFGWAYEDIDGDSVSIAGRLGVIVIGIGIASVSVLAGRGVHRLIRRVGSS